MTYRIICFTKSLALAITPFLFALVGIICESAIVPGVYNLLSPQEEEVHYNILPEGTEVQIHLYIGLLLNWKKYKQRIQLCYSVYNETKRHSEISIYFGFNECLRAIFS